MEEELTFIQMQNVFSIHFILSNHLLTKRASLKKGRGVSVEKALLDVDIQNSLDILVSIVECMFKNEIEMETV